MAKKNGGLVETESERIARQRTILCRFGEEALRANELDTVLTAATEAISEATGVSLVKVLELLPEQGKMLVRAGVGWNPGVVGNVTFGADEHSPSGYALLTSEPVISRDLANEERFAIPELLREHGVRSMINVVIAGQKGAWGVLEVDSPAGRQFDRDDIDFLRNYANFVAAAIDRVQASRERDEALEKNRVLLREVQHRIANLLGNVRALAAFTRKSSAHLDEFADSFDARLGALARTQALLTRGTEVNLELKEVLRLELEAHGVQENEKLVLSGPNVLIPPESARALSMVFHELATNATKHGAFGNPRGRLEVSWGPSSAEDDAELLLRWRETGINIVGTPSRRGMGFRMMEEGVPLMIGGTSSLTFRPDGVDYTLQFPWPKPRGPDAGDQLTA